MFSTNCFLKLYVFTFVSQRGRARVKQFYKSQILLKCPYMFMCMCDVSMKFNMKRCNWKCLNMHVCANIYMHGRLSIARTCYLLKTVMSNGIYHPYQLNESTSNCWVKNVNFIRILNNADPYQTSHYVASDLGLYVPQKGRNAYTSY